MSLPLEPLGLLTLPEARKGFQLGEAARRGGTRQNETDAKRGGRKKWPLFASTDSKNNLGPVGKPPDAFDVSNTETAATNR